MEKRIRILTLVLLLAAVAPRSQAYNDQRVERLDSLERAVAPWTPDRIDKASDDELAKLNRAYRDLMRGYSVLNGEKSNFYSRKALSISVPKGWEEASYDAYRYLGQNFYGAGQHDSAKVCYLKALDCIKRMDDTEKAIDDALSATYGAIGNLYNEMDSIPQAMAWYSKAGEIFDKYGWNESNTILHYNIGETWLDLKEYKKAKEAYEKALDYAGQSKDSLYIVMAWKGLGRYYAERRQNGKALPYLRNAQDYYAGHPDLSPVFRTENLEFIEDVLSRQKKQSAAFIILAILLIAAATVLIIRIRKHLRDRVPAASGAPSVAPEDIPVLNDREREILDLLSKGYTALEIAEAVNLSHETIRWYRKKIIAKFDVSNTPELISRAKECGLL
jgi:DNA-binding CsgD family transcriptional regulator